MCTWAQSSSVSQALLGSLLKSKRGNEWSTIWYLPIPFHVENQSTSFFAQVHSAEEKEEGGNLLWLSGLAEPFDVFLGFAGDS